MGLKLIRTKKSKRIPVELISLHTHLENKCRPNQKIVYFECIPAITNKSYFDCIMDVILNRGI
jgi:hypothetical protein